MAHGAIVAATGRSDRRGVCRGDRRSRQSPVGCSIKQVFVATTIACSVYTGRLSRRSSRRRLALRLPRLSPRVYPAGYRPVYTPHYTFLDSALLFRVNTQTSSYIGDILYSLTEALKHVARSHLIPSATRRT